jgi:WD40-like Beta Propeller Repeat
MDRTHTGSRWLTIIIVAAATAVGCGAPGVAKPSATLGTSAAHGTASPAARATAPGQGHTERQGLAEFSGSDGRLLRWLVLSNADPAPVAVSPDGRWVYYYNHATATECPRNGFTEPILWRVGARGGQPQRTGISTTSLAFSPDGRMMAYTSSRHCGRTIWLVIVSRRTGTSRRIVLAHNQPMQNNAVWEAQLSWAPDDTHLAVAVAPAAALNYLAVINVWQVTRAFRIPPIPPCAGDHVGCVDPSFDAQGRLTFVKWRQPATGTGFAEWVARWQHGRVVRLFRLSRDQSQAAPTMSVNRPGTTVLLGTFFRFPEIWRWSAGAETLLLRSSRHFIVTTPLWLHTNLAAAVRPQA